MAEGLLRALPKAFGLQPCVSDIGEKLRVVAITAPNCRLYG